MRAFRRVLAVLLPATLAACALHLPPRLSDPPRSLVVTSGGPNHSMTYLARVESGVIVIDLGWWGAEDAVREGLVRLGTTPEDVVAVFLTHSHRDHIGAWRLVRRSPFHLTAAEAPLLVGHQPHGGWIPRWASRIVLPDLPDPGELEVRAFSSDTAFAFGGDTLRAYLVPGHTDGSAAYLFRGQLFAGDAVARTLVSGFRPARAGYSDDVDRARRQLASLRDRISEERVRWLCSAHAKCARVSDALWRDLLDN